MKDDTKITGIELSEKFYRNCVLPILEKIEPALIQQHAAGLVGAGSEVIGFDDSYSRDHDWAPRLVIFVPEEQRKAISQRIFDIVCAEIPDRFLGFATRIFPAYNEENEEMNRGNPFISVTSPERFAFLMMGLKSFPPSPIDWLLIPEQRLLEFTSGRIFHDSFGRITELRKNLSYFPQDVWIYKLAFAFESIAWEFDLIADSAVRKNPISMKLNTARTVQRIFNLAFLAVRSYQPGYQKWMEKRLRQLSILSSEFFQRIQIGLSETNYEIVTSQLNLCIAELYELLKKPLNLPMTPPTVKTRFSEIIATQDIAALIMERIDSSPLKSIKTTRFNTSFGGIDQWLAHQDMLLSSEHLMVFKDIYQREILTNERMLCESYI